MQLEWPEIQTLATAQSCHMLAKSWFHKADDGNKQNVRSISHPGCTCGGDEIWVHGTGCLTCTKLRDPEHLWCFPSHINSNTGHISLRMLTHAPLARSRLRASLPISFSNQTSTNFGAIFTTKIPQYTALMAPEAPEILVKCVKND